MNAIVYCTILFTAALLPIKAPATQVRPHAKPWLRIEGGMSHLKLAPRGRFLAFTDKKGRQLRVLDILSKKVYAVAQKDIGTAFFWAADGSRLFYRQHVKTEAKTVKSQVFAFDLANGKRIKISEYPQATGFLTYDPRDLRFRLLHKNGVYNHRLVYPDQRLARWQISQRTDNGVWVAAPTGIYWLTQGGLSMQRMDDDGSPVVSFSISANGENIVWATEKQSVYMSLGGKTALTLGRGKDPSWHPTQELAIYSGARLLGRSVAGYDLRIVDSKGSGQFITNTRGSVERWPVWHPTSSKVIYSIDGSTDMHMLEFKPIQYKNISKSGTIKTL